VCLFVSGTKFVGLSFAKQYLSDSIVHACSTHAPSHVPIRLANCWQWHLWHFSKILSLD
jgi:hypothetical protein